MKKLLIILALIMFGLIAVGAWGYFTFFNPIPQRDSAAAAMLSSPSVGQSVLRAKTPGWLEYRNTDFHFSILYPETMGQLSNYYEGKDARTISFEDAQNKKSFQIFVTPYTEPQVSPERFKADNPSGVMKEPVNVTIDGANATMFYSTDPNVGDTREVWFIHNGYLFEVTASKDLDTLLQGILKTWEFI